MSPPWDGCRPRSFGALAKKKKGRYTIDLSMMPANAAPHNP
jgi:hypothetical protein